MHHTICPNIGDYCTDEQCLNGTCITLDGTLGCPATFVVDSEGHPRETPYTRSACAVIPMRTDCVRVRIWYFSREYPQFTGTGSQFNDTLQYEISVPGQELQYGSTNVNDLHSAFDEDGYYLVSDQQYHLSSWTDYDPIEIRMRATATNIRDNQLGSAVIFEIRCDTVDVDYDSVAEVDELDPGGFLCLNDDDDNQNGIPDMDEPGQVVGEDDLVPVVISSTMSLYPGSVDFGATSGSSRVRFYANPDRTDLLWGTQYWTPQELPKTVYVEGIASSQAVRDTTLRGRRASCEDRVLLTVAHLPIEIRYRTFIAAEAFSGGWNIYTYDYYGGDNRGFTYSGGTSRSFQSYKITIDPSDPIIGLPIEVFSQSNGYNHEPPADTDVVPCPPICPGFTFGGWCLAPTATAECPDTAVNGQEGNNLSLTAIPTSIGEMQFALALVAYNPCVTAPLGIEPAIDSNIVFAFRQRCVSGSPQPVEYKIVSGSHDAFPWHELYIHGSSIYTFNPCTHPGGPDVNQLWGGGQTPNQDVFLNVANPLLANWRVVPGQ